MPAIRFVSFCISSLCLAIAAAQSVSAQVYSEALSDDGNSFDAPIPGYVGPAGDGFSSLFPGNEANAVNPIFLSWADSVAAYEPVTDDHADDRLNLDPFWMFSGEALGPASGDAFAVVALGDLDEAAVDAGAAPGSLTVRFAERIRNLSGADFAVFENGAIAGADSGGAGIGGIYAELAYVEVSSNGVDFIRFPSFSNTPGPVGAYGSIDPTKIYNLAGKHVNGYGESWGTPFDLDDLADHELVQSGTVNLDQISHVRLVDIPGNGSFTDSLENPIYDPWVTWGSGGADIDAIGAIAQALTYEKWAAGRSLDPAANGDEDRFCNLEEYAYRLDPEKAEWPEIPAIQMSGDNTLLSFPRDQRNADVTYVIEAQGDAIVPDGWIEIARIGPLDAEAIESSVVSRIDYRSSAQQASIGVLQTVTLTIETTGVGSFFRLVVEEVQ